MKKLIYQKQSNMVCVTCRKRGPMIRAKEWRGWSQCGVEFLPPSGYRPASYCPACHIFRETYGYLVGDKGWSLSVLKKRFAIGGGILESL